MVVCFIIRSMPGILDQICNRLCIMPNIIFVLRKVRIALQLSFNYLENRKIYGEKCRKESKFQFMSLFNSCLKRFLLR